jgi:hypothetical protein
VVSSVRRTETYFASAKLSRLIIFIVIAESLVVHAIIVVFVGVITSFVV